MSKITLFWLVGAAPAAAQGGWALKRRAGAGIDGNGDSPAGGGGLQEGLPGEGAFELSRMTRRYQVWNSVPGRGIAWANVLQKYGAWNDDGCAPGPGHIQDTDMSNLDLREQQGHGEAAPGAAIGRRARGGKGR